MVGSFSHSEVLLSVLENEGSFFYTPTLTGSPSGISYWLEGAAASLFQISPMNGEIVMKDGYGLNYEDKTIPNHSLNFSIIASDGTVTATQSVQLRILNLLDQAGEAVFTLPATDDNNGPLRYQLINNDVFNLDSSGHVVTLAKDISTSKLNSSWAMPLQVYNAAGNLSVQNLSFYLGNDAVTDMVVWRNIGNYYLLDEDKKQVVQQLSAISQSGQKITSYGLVGNDASYFSIDGQNQLLLLSTADYDNPRHGSRYMVKVVAHTNNGVTGQQQIDIDLRNTIGLDGGPVINKQYNENQQRGVIYTATANDASDVVYSIRDPENYFSIDKKTGQVSFKRPIDMRALGTAGQVDNTPFEAPDKIVVEDSSQLSNISVKDLTNKRLVVVNNDTTGLINDIKQKISPSWKNSTLADAPSHLLYSVVVYAASQSTSGKGAAYASQLLILSINASPHKDVLNWSDGQQNDSQTISLPYADVKNNPALRFGATNVGYNNPVWYGLNNNANFAINTKTGQVSLRSGVALNANQEYSFVVTAFSGQSGTPVSISKLVTLVGGVAVNQHNPRFVIPEESMAQRPVVDFSFNNGAGGTTLELVDGSPDKNYFQISGTQLQFVSSIDYENRGGHAATYTAVVKFNQSSSGGNLSLVQSYIVTLVNIDDNPIGFSKKVETVSLIDNGTAGLSIADFDALDLDGQLVSYSLAGHDAANFVISKNGTIQLVNSLNGDARPVYSLVVKAHSYGGNVMGGAAATEVTQLLTVRVNNDNNVTKQVSEGETFIGSFANMVGIDAASLDNAEFQIVGNALRFKQAKDYEAEARHNYTAVVLTNNDGILGRKQVIIQTQNINDSDVVFNQVNAGVAMTENNVVGVALASFVASDADGQMVSYSLAGDDATFFSIDGRTGVVTLRSVLDYEEANHVGHVYSLVVRGHSFGGDVLSGGAGGNNVVSSLFILSLLNVNDHPIGFAQTADGIVMNEGNVANQSIANFQATDMDQQVISYSVDGDDAAYFNIDGRTGVLSLASALDYESSDHASRFYSVVVVARSHGDANGVALSGGANDIISKLFILSLQNIDDTAPAFTQAVRGISISENNEADLVLSTFQALDAEGQAVSYSLSGDDAAYFTIDASTGVLTLRSVLDNEATNHAGHLYSVIVRAHGFGDGRGVWSADGPGNYVGSTLFILSLQDIDDNAPQFVFDSNMQRWDNRSYTVGMNKLNSAETKSVFSYTAIDLDSQSISYSIVAGSDTNFFSINADSGEMFFLSSLNFEDYEGSEYRTGIFRVNVMVNSYGNGVLAGTVATSAVEEVIFYINNINDNDTYFRQVIAGASVNENNITNLVVATFLADDIDGQQVSYSLAGSDAGYFSINKSNGRLILLSTLDYESSEHFGPYYSVIVRGHSYGTGNGFWAEGGQANNIVSALFILSAMNADDNDPAFFRVSADDFSISITESNGVGAVLTTLRASDADGQGISYSLVAGDDSDYFSINARSGKLSFTSSLDFETHAADHPNGVFQVKIKATSYGRVLPADGASLSAIQNFTFNLINTNDNAPDFTAALPGMSVNENNAINVSLTSFIALDPDGQSISYSLRGDDAAYFSVDAATGVLSLTSALDYESSTHGNFYSVVVHAYAHGDGNGSLHGLWNGDNRIDDISRLFILSLYNIDDNQPQFSQTSSGDSLNENNSANVILATFQASDVDGESISYSLGGADSSYFTIDSTSGVVSLVSVLDYESPNHAARFYSVMVIAHGYGDGVGSWGGATSNAVASSLYILSLQNTDEFAPRFVDTAPRFATIFENNIPNITLAQFSAFDADMQNINYSLLGNSAKYFSINSNGQLLLVSSLDCEEFFPLHDLSYNLSYTVTVQATSSRAGMAGGGANSIINVTTNFVLKVSNVDDLTQWKGNQLTGLSLNENNTAGLIVSTFTAFDPDGWQGIFTEDPNAITYDISGVDKNYFTINAKTGVLQIARALDYDSGHAPYYSIVITAREVDGGGSVTSNLVLSLFNADDNAPVFVRSTSENTFAGTQDEYITERVGVRARSVFTMTAMDADGQAVSYSLLPGNDNNFFSIDSNTGEVYFRSTLDYDSYAGTTNYNKPFAIKVLATSYGSNTVGGTASTQVSQTVVFYIQNIDDNAPNFIQTRAGTAIKENNIANLFLTNFNAIDTDGQPISYSLVGDDAKYFSINNDLGELSLVSVLDSENIRHVSPFYSIVVRAHGYGAGNGFWKDGPASDFVSSLFVLTLLNVDDNAPQFISPTTYYFAGSPFFAVSAVEDNETNQIVTTLIANDADGQSISYSLVAGSDSNYFSINANTGELYFKSALDYEYYFNKGLSTNFQVKVKATSYGGTLLPGTASISAVQNLNFSLINGNDNTPYFKQALGGISLTENNTANLSLANFTAIDLDGQSVSYFLTGDDADYFSIYSTGALLLRSSLDYESAARPGQFYSVVVHANSYGSGYGNWNKTGPASDSISSLFILSLGNADDNAFVVTKRDSFVDKATAANGFQVFSANDKDGSSVSYSLQQVWSSTPVAGTNEFVDYFSIDNTGTIRLNNDGATNNIMNTIAGDNLRYDAQYFVVRATSKGGAGGGLDSSITATIPVYFYKSHDVGAGVSDTGGPSSSQAIDVFNITSKDFVSIGGVNDVATSQLYSLGLDGVKFSNSAFGVGDSYDNPSDNAPSNQHLLTTNLVNLQNLGADKFHNIKSYLFNNKQKDVIFVSTADLNNMVGADKTFDIYLDSYDKIYLLDTPPIAISPPFAKVLPYLVNNNEVITGQNLTPTNSLTILDDRYTDIYKMSESSGNHYYQSVNGNIYGYDNRQDVLHINGLHYLNAAGNQTVINNISALQSYVVDAGGALNNNGDGKVQLVENTLLDANNNVLSKQYAIKLGLVKGATNTAYDALIYLSNQDMSTGTNLDLTTTYSNYMAGGVADSNNPNIHYHDLSFNDFLALLGGKDHFVFS